MAVAFVLLLPAQVVAQGQDLELMFGDGFETGNLDRWADASTDGGDLSASGAAALVGSFGLQAVVNNAGGIYVQDNLPPFWYWYEEESYYHASFRFDPNGFDPGEAQGSLRTRIFIAFEEAPQRRLLALVLRRREGQFALMGRVRQDDGSQVDTGFFDITDDPHLVEVVWHRAKAPDANDGLFRLSIDGIVVSTQQGLDNSISGIDFIRLGALSVKNGASGTLYWDDFRAFRDLAPARAQLVINEVDYEQAGADTHEFVEIYNRGPATVDMLGARLLIIDGASHGLHGLYNSSDRYLPAGQYLVFAGPALTVVPGAQRRDFSLERDSLGNGAPDAVVLLHDAGSRCEVIDTLSYEGPVSASLRPTTCGYIGFVEGTMLSADVEDSDVVPGSLIRHPNGSDTDDAATDWMLSSTPTPGAPNVP